MRLLIIIPYYEPAWAYGGPPKLLSNIARLLAARHDVTVLTTDVLDRAHRAQPAEEQLGGVRVIRCRTMSNMLSWKTKIIIPMRCRRVVADEIRAADFVYLSDFRHWLNAVALNYLIRYRTPYSLSAFGQIQMPMNLKWPLKVLFDWMWGRRLVRHASVLIAQTEHEADDYRRVGGQSAQVRIIPLAEHLPSANECAQQGIFRKKHQLNPTTKILLFVGRIQELKGLDLLVRAVAETHTAVPQLDMRLVIVGRDDGFQARLDQVIAETHLQDMVIQTGPLYGADNAACYADADLFVFTPTHFEETSLASVRALSFGVPVLTVYQAELPFLDAYGAGQTVECDRSVVARALTQLLDADILRSKREAALRLFREKYTFEHTIHEIEDVIQNGISTIQK